MPDFYFSVNLDAERTLCLAPLTDRRMAMADVTVTDPGGYFLFEKRGSDECGQVQIIAQVFSEDAVFRLRELFGMA
jgi:hypothetical protein